jgi:hypothetical protein
MFKVVNKWTAETLGFRIGFGLAFAVLLLVVGWDWAESYASLQKTFPGSNHDVRIRVFERMEPSPIEFEIRIPKENVVVKTIYYQEVGIDGSEWSHTVVQQAAEICVEWAPKKEAELSENGRLKVGLTVAARIVLIFVINEANATDVHSVFVHHRQLNYFVEVSGPVGAASSFLIGIWGSRLPVFMKEKQSFT